MEAKVSILIPVYNAAQWLSETINSALNQSHKNIEVILVDDGSTDSSADVIAAFTDPRITFVQQPNSGAAVARNAAFHLSTGNYIQYLDADDLLEKTKIEIQLQRLQGLDNETTIASGRWARFHSSPDEADFSPIATNRLLWCDSNPLTWLIESWRVNGMMHPAAWLVPRYLCEAAGKWDETLSLNDDGEYFARVLLKSSQIAFCSEARSYYRSGMPASLSQTLSDSACDSLYRSIKQISKLILAERSDPDTKLVCANAFKLYQYTTYPLRPDLYSCAEEQITTLGGASLKMPGGPRIKTIEKFVGWKTAKRLQKLLR
jgi:glycosyltransferase involved in cell wall biosynthesis